MEVQQAYYDAGSNMRSSGLSKVESCLSQCLARFNEPPTFICLLARGLGFQSLRGLKSTQLRNPVIEAAWNPFLKTMLRKRRWEPIT